MTSGLCLYCGGTYNANFQHTCPGKALTNQPKPRQEEDLNKLLQVMTQGRDEYKLRLLKKSEDYDAVVKERDEWAESDNVRRAALKLALDVGADLVEERDALAAQLAEAGAYFANEQAAVKRMCNLERALAELQKKLDDANLDLRTALESKVRLRRALDYSKEWMEKVGTVRDVIEEIERLEREE